MKKGRRIKSVGGIMIVLFGTFPLLGQTPVASPTVPQAQNQRQKQSQQRPKATYQQTRRATTNPSSFTPDMPFSEAIDILRNSTVPPLNIAVLWRDLEENADIYKDTPIGMDGLSRVPLRTHLKVLLMSVSGSSAEKLGYVVDEGVIIIATQDSLPRKAKARIYDITDLVSEPANYRFMPGFGMPFGFGFDGMVPYGGTGYGQRGFYGRMGPYNGAGRTMLIGRTSAGRGFNRNSYVTASPNGYRSRELADLIETMSGYRR